MTQNSRPSDATPLDCPLTYRPIHAEAPEDGQGISLSGGEIRFRGALPMKKGIAAELRLQAIRGLSPPLTAYVEVTLCEPAASGGYTIAGEIKGLRSP